MKKVKICLALLIVCGVLFALFYHIQTEITPEPISYGSVYTPEGTWTEDSQDSRLVAVYSFSLPQGESQEEQVLLLQSHWTDYDVYVDDSLIFAAVDGDAGSCILMPVPEGQTLLLRFYYEDESTLSSIMQSKLLLGSKSAMNRLLLRDTFYAVAFSMLSLVMGIACIGGALFSRGGRFGDISKSLAYLGAYVLCAGMWILTDSQILVLATQRTGLVEMISFLAFFTMPIPLMGFTKKMLPDRERTFGNFQLLFTFMLLFYVVNEIGGFLSYILILVAEHVVISGAILVMLYTGRREMHKHWDAKLHRIVLGYSVLCVCSAMALIFFYKQLNLAYSISYVIGIVGFVCFLADSVWVAACAQVEAHANMALYAKMAYTDALTGLGNRAAFLETEKENRTYPNSLAYIMVDANNLKLVNDTLGHQKGDDLLTCISNCMTRAVGKAGRCFRVGGDEFIVCLKAVPQESVMDYVRAIQQEIQEADSQSDFIISAAIGYAWTQAAVEEDLEQLLRQADDAMYDIKKKMKEELRFRSKTG